MGGHVNEWYLVDHNLAKVLTMERRLVSSHEFQLVNCLVAPESACRTTLELR